MAVRLEHLEHLRRVEIRLHARDLVLVIDLKDPAIAKGVQRVPLPRVLLQLAPRHLYYAVRPWPLS
jgi:hypothetical protein